jgi:hypothetical protein
LAFRRARDGLIASSAYESDGRIALQIIAVQTLEVWVKVSVSTEHAIPRLVVARRGKAHRSEPKVSENARQFLKVEVFLLA